MNVEVRITGVGETGIARASGRSPIELATEAAMDGTARRGPRGFRYRR
jgi:hypothetical protein